MAMQGRGQVSLQLLRALNWGEHTDLGLGSVLDVPSQSILCSFPSGFRPSTGWAHPAFPSPRAIIPGIGHVS